MFEDIRGDLEDHVLPLMRDIVEDTQKLLRQEFALAKVEVREDAKRARDVLGYLVAASFFLGISAVLFSVALSHLFVEAFPHLSLWQGYLAVALLSGAAGAILMRIVAKKSRKIRIFPEQTASTLRESAQWMQDQASM